MFGGRNTLPVAMAYREFLEPLSSWKLQTPLAKDGTEDDRREIQQPELNELLAKTPEENSAATWFHAEFCGCSGLPALVLKTPVSGVTGYPRPGPHYPRTELAQNSDVRWSMFEGRHEMKVKAAVNHLPRGKPACVISQIKGAFPHHTASCSDASDR